MACLLPALATALACSGAFAQEKGSEFKVALLQMRPNKDNIVANLDKAERYCREAANQKADVALMPEMWSTGYTDFDPKKPGAREEFWAKALRTDSEPIRRFAALAKELQMAIGLTYMQAFAPAPRDVITLFDRHGHEVFTYAKVHTADFKAMEAALTPGDAFVVGDLDTKAGPVKVGAMICFDREQPESARILILEGAEIILTPNACILNDLRLDQFKVRAWENVVGVALANYPPPKKNGQSAAYDAEGQCLVRAGKSEGVFMACFDLKKLRELRAKSIWGNAYRRPHRYQLLAAPGQSEVWHRTDGSGTPFDPSKR